MKYLVTAIAVDPNDGTIVGGPRDEEIDTETNELFHHRMTPWEVEDAYEAFWNRLNSSWEHDFPYGKGGDLSLTNIKLLCEPHNRLLAEADYGRAAVQAKVAESKQRRRFDRATSPTQAFIPAIHPRHLPLHSLDGPLIP